MGIFRNEKYEDMLASLAKSVAELERTVSELQEKLDKLEEQDFQEAVSDGVTTLWNKTLRDIIDYDPMTSAASFKEVDIDD